MVHIVRGNYNEYEILGCLRDDGSATWQGGGKTFDNYPDLIAYLDHYELESRTNFTNKTAYMVERGFGWNKNTWYEVEVLDVHANGRAATVRYGERLMNVNLEALYESKEGVKLYVQYLDTLEKNFNREKQDLQDALDKTRWTPRVE